MKSLIIKTSVVLVLGVTSMVAIAEPDKKICFDAHLLAGGGVNHFEFQVVNRHGDVAEIIGEGCYPNNLNNSEVECSSGLGLISVHNGKIELTFNSSDHLPNTDGYAFQRATSHFLIDRFTLKGEGGTLVEFPDQQVLDNVHSVKEGIIDSTIEFVSCAESFDSPSDDKILTRVLSKADNL